MNIDRVTAVKASITAFFGLLTALWGWFGWLILVWTVCMALDYLTGSAAACKAGEWSSRSAREGIWHKAGSLAVVAVAGILDLGLGVILARMPGVALPLDDTVFICPLAVTWYILTELGSIVENAGRMGAPIPGWLRRAVAVLRDKVDGAAEQ